MRSSVFNFQKKKKREQKKTIWSLLFVIGVVDLTLQKNLRILILVPVGLTAQITIFR